MSIITAKDLYDPRIKKETREITEALKELAAAQELIQKNAQGVSESINNANESRSEAIESTKALEEQTQKLIEQEQKIKELQKQISDLIKKNTKEKDKNTEEQIRARLERQKENKQIREAIQLEEAEEKSIARLRSENKRLRRERDLIGTATQENRDRIAELNDQIDENTEIITENVDALSQQKIGIGGYADAIREVIPGLDGMVEGVGAVRAQFMSLLANPIVALIAAIAGGLILLGKAFGKTEQGQKAFAKASAGVGAAMDSLIGRASKLSLEMVKAFENPQKAVKDLWQVIQTNLVNRIKGLGDLFLNFGKIYAKSWEVITKSIVGGKEAREKAIEELKSGASDLATAFIQLQTGLDADQQKKFVAGMKDLGDEMSRAAIEAGKLAELKFQLFSAEQQAKVTLASLEKLGEGQAAIADDATLSFQQRQEAAEAAEKAELKRANIEINLAKQRLAIADRELKFAESNAERNEELISNRADAQAELINAQKEQELALFESQKRIRELNQDDWEQQLDFLIDVADVQKTINERRIADETTTLSARQAILQETINLMSDSYDQQIALFETENQIQIDRNKLAKLNNEEIFNYARGLELSEIETNRLLEVIRERRIAEQDLSDLESELNSEKIARIQKANDTIRGINQAAEIEAAKSLESKKQLEIRNENERFNTLIKSDVLLNEEREALQAQHNQRLSEINEEYRKAEEQKNKELYKKAADGLGQVSTAAQSVFDYQNTLRDAEIQAVEQKNEKELEMLQAKQEQEILDAEKRGEDTTELQERQAKQREKLLKEQDKEEKKLRKRQAEAQKKQNIFSAVIDTAAAIAKTAGNLGFPAAIPAIAFVGALGALQIATISATPIPAFAKGGVKDKDGVALFGEAGREIFDLPTGERYIAEGPTVAEVPKGTTFYSNPETEKMLAESGGVTVQKYDEMISEIKGLKKVMSAKDPVREYNFNEGGMTQRIIDNGTIINENDKYFNP